MFDTEDYEVSFLSQGNGKPQVIKTVHMDKYDADRLFKRLVNLIDEDKIENLTTDIDFLLDDLRSTEYMEWTDEDGKISFLPYTHRKEYFENLKKLKNKVDELYNLADNYNELLNDYGVPKSKYI